MSFTVWLTGLSGAGKSTLAQALAETFAKHERACCIIDGDGLRSGLCSDLSFSRRDRMENIRRAAETCRILNSSNVIAIAALISPYQSDRDMARRIIGPQAYQEVWLSTALSVCEKRDVKGLYQKARSGEISSFTGVSDPYEMPPASHLILDTSALSIDECLSRLAQLPAIHEVLK